MPSGPSLVTLRDAQLAYAARGWRTFLVRPGTKLPRYKGWQAAATTDPAIIRSIRSARCSDSLRATRDRERRNRGIVNAETAAS